MLPDLSASLPCCLQNIIGLVLVKELLLVDEQAGVRVNQLRLRELPFIRWVAGWLAGWLAGWVGSGAVRRVGGWMGFVWGGRK